MKRTIYSLVVFGVLFLATALASHPARAAEFGMTGNYKYVLGLQFGDGDTNQAMGHGVQVDFLWALGPVEEGTKVPGIAMGFNLAGGGLVGDATGGFYKIAFLSEFNQQSGLGFTFGVGGGHLIIDEQDDIWGLGFTDLGLRYSLKNGLIFSTSVDLMFDPITAAQVSQSTQDQIDGNEPSENTSNPTTFILGVAVGVGYRF